MPKISREEQLSNSKYIHILIEGIDDIKVFKDKRNKDRYLKTTNIFAKKYNQELLGYLILDNSAHFIFKKNDIKELSTMVKSINLSYAQIYNRSHRRGGTTFKNRYRSEPLNSDRELISCLAYIHSKPVIMKYCIFNEQYIHSSANDYALQQSEILSLDVIKDVFGYIPTIPNGTTMKFIDTKSDYNENIETVLMEIVDRYNITSMDSLKNDSLLYLICKELKVRTQASLREIARRLNVSRERVRKLMKMDL